MTLANLIADMAPEVTAGLIGFGGSLVGGTIAALVTLHVTRETHLAAERDWIRESRRALYDGFLEAAQSLLDACDTSAPDQSRIVDAHSRFFQAYARVQLVATPEVVRVARAQAYRLWELEHEVLRDRPVLDPQNAAAVSRSARDARHDTIDAMRRDLDPRGKAGSAKPCPVYNPFVPPHGRAESDDYLEPLRKAYADELEKAGDNRHKVRPGWEGSRDA